MKKCKNYLLSAIAATLVLAAICLPCALTGRTVANAAETKASLHAYLPIMQEVKAGGKIDEKATNLLIRLDANMNVITESGEIIAPLSEFDTGSATPVYFVKNTTAANNIAQKLSSEGVTNAVVASDKASLVLQMRQRAVTVSGMLDCRNKSIETRDDWDAIRIEANTNGARSVLVSGNVSAQCIRFLRRLSFAVYVEVSTDAEIVNAVGGGATGLMSANPTKTREKADTLCGDVLAPPIIVAHRGLSGIPRENGSEYHENTVEAAWAAYTLGGADTVEIDIYLSKDNELVVMHNPSLGGTTTGSNSDIIQNMTLEQIRQYKVIGSGMGINTIQDPIPTLDDYFKKFKGEDLNIFVEIKGDKAEIVPKLKEKIEQYGMASQVTVITFTEKFLSAFREIMPEVSTGLLYNYSADNISNILRKANAYNATFNPSYAGLTAQEIGKYNRCGITVWPWTFRIEEVFKNEFWTVASGGLTLDYCGWLKTWVKRMEPESLLVSAVPGERFAISCNRVTYGNGTSESAYRVQQLSGDIDIVLDEKGYLTASGVGSAEIVLTYGNASPDYKVVSQPITVISQEKKADEPPAPTPNPSGGCKSAAAGASISLAVIVLSLAAAAILWRRKRCK